MDAAVTVVPHPLLVGKPSADQIFVVRTWLECSGDQRTMRGRIDHVASGRRRYFANFGDLCDFINEAQPPVMRDGPPDGRSGNDGPLG